MKSIILNKPTRFTIESLSEPDSPGHNEVLVRIHRVGICGTDLHAYQGRQPFFSYPRILGHELGVEILKTGEDVQHIQPGDRCAVIPYLHCGACLPCRMGKTNCCTELSVLGVHTDGGMRTKMILPADKLLPSTSLTFEQLALVETLGIGAHAVQRADLKPGEKILLIGAGPIGLAVLEFAQISDVDVILLERSKKRISFCEEHYNLFGIINNIEQIERELLNALHGDLPTAVFDATGNVQSMNKAHQLVSNGGRLIYVGFTQEAITFKSAEFHRREMTLISSRNARKADLQRVMDHIETGAIDTTPWITHRTNATEMTTEFPRWLDPEYGVIKAILEMT